MQFITNSIDFSAALQTVTMAVATRSPSPALECVLIEAKNADTVSFTGSDGSIRITCVLSCTVVEQGEAILRGRMLEEVVRKFPHGEITVSSDSRNYFTVKSGKVRSRMQGDKAELYPATSPAEIDSSITLPANRLYALISSTEACIGSDESRPVLTGGCLEGHDDAVTMVGLDGYRLALRTMRDPAQVLKSDAQVIIPSRALGMLKKLISRAGENNVTLSFGGSAPEGGNTLEMSYDNIHFSCALIEGQYVDYRKIMPKNFATTVQISAQQLRDAVERIDTVAAAAQKGQKVVRFSILENEITLSGQSALDEISETIDAAIEGPQLTISFSTGYFDAALKQFTDGDIVLGFNSAVSPCVVHYADGTDADADEFLWLILPVRTA